MPEVNVSPIYIKNNPILLMKPPRKKKIENVTIETIMEPHYERDDIIQIDEESDYVADTPKSRRRSRGMMESNEKSA